MSYNDTVLQLATEGQQGNSVEALLASNSEYDQAVQQMADESMSEGSDLDLAPAPSPYNALMETLYKGREPSEEAQKPTGLQSPYAAGMDAQQAMWGHGFQTLWNSLGGDPETIQGIVDWADDNQQQAGMTELEGFGDKLAFAGGQITAAMGAITGGALAAKFLVPVAASTYATGALVTGTLADALSSTGELTQKAVDLDPEYKGDLKTLGTGTALGGVGGLLQLKRFTPMIKPLTDLMTEAGEVAVKGGRAGSRLGNLAIESGKAAGVTGSVEAVQDAASSVAAHSFTGTNVDGSKALAIAQASAEEFAIGAVFGGVGGLATGYSKDVAARQREWEIEAEAKMEELPTRQPLQDETGQLDPDAIAVPVQDAVRSPGSFNLFGTKLFGKSTDYTRKKFAKNKYAQTFVQQFHVDRNNPQLGVSTVNEEAAVRKGLLDDIAHEIYRASPEQVEEAGQRRANGTPDMSNPIDQAMHNIYDIAIPSEYKAVGRGNVDMSSLQWNDEKYLPIGNRFNWDAARKDPARYEEALVRHMTEDGRSPEVIDGAVTKLRRALYEQDLEGNPVYDGVRLDEKVIDSLVNMNEEVLVGEADRSSLGKKMNALTRSYNESSLKKSPLNLSRLIPEAPQSFWEDSTLQDKKVSLKDAITADIKKKADHLAYADKFGFQNEVGFELISQAIVESHQPGQTPMSALDIENMMDIMRLQQGLPTKTIRNPHVRRAMMGIKSYTGMMILGASALMSIPETVITGYKTSLGDWGRSIGLGLKDAPKDNQKRAYASMTDIGHGWHDTMSLAASRIGETAHDMPRWESTFVQYFTGLPAIQFALSASTLKATDYNMRRVISDYAEGKSPEVRRHAKLRLIQMGVDPQQAVNWMKSGFKRSHAFYDTQWLPKLYTGLRTTIVEPKAVDKPVWMGAEHWMLISQLKSFVFTFQNLVLNDSYKQMRNMGPAGNRELVLRAAPYLAAYILAQVGILTAKEYMREGEIEDDQFINRLTKTVFQQGALSVLGDSFHAVAGRTGTLESASPAAGFITRQVRGNKQLITDILSGNISPEEVVKEAASVNTPRTLADPIVRSLYDEAFGTQ